MLTNLFSIFDSSSSSLFGSNWLIFVLIFSLIPISFWKSSARPSKLFKLLAFYLSSELKPLSMKFPFLSLSMISIFLFIMLSNLTGLLPYVYTSSSHMMVSLAMAFTAWNAINIYGSINQLNHQMAHLVPIGTPGLLMPFMVLIETISNNIRPITLSVRLSANMIAGHLLIALLSGAMVGAMISYPILLISGLALGLLELAVALIQAYVFTLLLMLYASEM
uniref:ATP synthase subunit a n=1 Tax=Bactrurus brachycaudus TaxID=111554 RepID=A0A6C0X4U0_9CRUS|nr:ATP synthase F0 subunit 6 [Bactrurus brachycaudus]QIC54383.1 ATP synthase F0 subunit 6 [Bactrurus brachycaudus]